MTTSIAAAACAVSLAAPAHAQVEDRNTEFVPEGELKTRKKGERDGWDGALSLGANVSLAQNDNVVGQSDGISALFGVSLLAGLDYLSGPHELRNTLTLQESWAKTPALDEFVKNADNLNLETLYNYFISGSFGVFGRFNLGTSILPGEDVRAEAKVYRQEGTTNDSTPTTRFRLSDSFQPLNLAESIGVFVEPYKSDSVAVSFRIGAGARETFSDGVRLLSGEDDMGRILFKTLENVYQGGVEAFGGMSGKLLEKRLTWELGADVMIPFINNDGAVDGPGTSSRNAIDLMIWGVHANAALSVFTWMTVNYAFRVRQDPQLLNPTGLDDTETVQISNSLLLTFKYDFVERDKIKKKKEVDPALLKAQQEAAAAADRAKAAEEAAKAAEERAKAAEEAAEAAKKQAEEAQKQKDEAMKEKEDALKPKTEGTEGAEGGATTPKTEGAQPEGGSTP